MLLRSDLAIAVRSRNLDTKFESLAQACGNQIGFRAIPQLLQRRGVRLFHPATQYDCRIWQFTTKASNGVAHVSRAACIQIDQADDRNAGGLKPKDIGGRKRSRLRNARRQPMCRAELREHDRCRFIDQTTSGHAENGMVTLSFRQQSHFAEDRQMLIRRIFRHALHRRGCFRVCRRADLRRWPVVLVGKIVGEFGDRVSDLG